MSRCRQHGFTLAEMMIVIVIMGVLAAIALPSFTKLLERRKLVGATDVLLSDLIFAKTETLKRNKVVRISFKNSGGTNWCYGMKVGSSCDCSVANDCSIDGVEKVRKASDFPGVKMSWDYTGNYTQFDQFRGYASPSGTVKLSIDGDQTQVQSTLQGRVRACTTTSTGGYPSC